MIPIAESYTCPQCHRTSFNPNDIRTRYCGGCHMFEDQMENSPEANLNQRFRPFVDALSRALVQGGAFGPMPDEISSDGTIQRVRIVIDQIEVKDAAAMEQMLARLGIAN